MTTTISRGRRHTLALAALDLMRSGQSASDALTNTIGGLDLSKHDANAIELELAGLWSAIPVGSEGDANAEAGSDPDAHENDKASGGPIIAPPGAAERGAEVERIASGEAARAKGARRSIDERLADAEQAHRDAGVEVARLRMLKIADVLAKRPEGVSMARMAKAAIYSDLLTDAAGFVRRGMRAIGDDAACVDRICGPIDELLGGAS
jgi:hypothetical protein